MVETRMMQEYKGFSKVHRKCMFLCKNCVDLKFKLAPKVTSFIPFLHGLFEDPSHMGKLLINKMSYKITHVFRHAVTLSARQLLSQDRGRRHKSQDLSGEKN